MAMTVRNVQLVEELRQRIDAKRIITRLQNHIHDKVKMSDTQVRSAAILLRKVLPDLANVELQVNGGGPVLIVTGIMRPGEQATMIERSPTKVLEHEPMPGDGIPQAVSPTSDAAPAKADSTG